jgi:alpha/beta hydrolase family protein
VEPAPSPDRRTRATDEPDRVNDPFPATEGQRAAKGDRRQSIAARYPGKAAYLDEVNHAAQCLIDAGYLLPEDLERILAQSARRWDLLASAPKAAAASLLRALNGSGGRTLARADWVKERAGVLGRLEGTTNSATRAE